MPQRQASLVIMKQKKRAAASPSPHRGEAAGFHQHSLPRDEARLTDAPASTGRSPPCNLRPQGSLLV